MPPIRPIALAVAVVVTCAGLVAPAYADPELPTLPDPAASEALEAAEDALAGKGDLEPTLALADLYAALPDLSGDERTTARQILARPDGTAPFFGGEPRYPNPGAVRCGAHVCVHYATSKALLGPDHRPPATDRDADGVPDWVETTSAVMEEVWLREVSLLRYRSPLSDGTRGGNNKLDVYLADVGKQGYYGYAQPEADGDGNPSTATAHMVLDNDYLEFAGGPMVSLKATAAHEFFHAVQFAYDVNEESWLLETTATWMEEQVYDAVNDNRNFLQASSLRHPEVPLDSPDVWYGNWIFFQFLTERLGRETVRGIWLRASQAGVPARTAITRTLRARGSDLRPMFASFSASNNVPGRSYEEGRFYPTASITKSWTLSRATRTTGSRHTVLDHLASRNYVFVPGRSLTGRWRIRVSVNAPSSYATAYALVRYRDGRLSRVPIRLNGYGNGGTTLRFGHAPVSKVMLNLGNASASDSRVTWFRATARR